MDFKDALVTTSIGIVEGMVTSDKESLKDRFIDSSINTIPHVLNEYIRTNYDFNPKYYWNKLCMRNVVYVYKGNMLVALYTREEDMYKNQF